MFSFCPTRGAQVVRRGWLLLLLALNDNGEFVSVACTKGQFNCSASPADAQFNSPDAFLSFAIAFTLVDVDSRNHLGPQADG
jgi:hypothetical protein